MDGSRLPDRYSRDGRAIYPTSKTVWYVCLLAVSKFFRVTSLFISYDVLKLIHVVYFLCAVKTIAGVTFVVIQKPVSSGKKLTKYQWLRICRHATFSNIVSLLWLFGLTLCGPFRSVLLFDHSTFTILMVVSGLFSATSCPSKVRGAVLFIVSVIILLLFDNDSLRDDSEHPEGQQHHGFSHLFYFVVSRMGVADHKGGVILLVATMCFNTGLQAASRKLSVEIGGAKRLHSLSSAISAIQLIVVSLFLHIFYEPLNASPMSLFSPICFVAIFMFVLDYYIENICVQRLEMGNASRYSTLASVCAAFILTLIWTHPNVIANDSEEHSLSGGLIISAIVFLFATQCLCATSSNGSKNKFVGYSASGSPLYTYAGDAINKTSQSILLTMRSGLKQILEESDSRKIFYFLCLNLMFTNVELIYGIWTNSLGLISDGFHMLFDCSALVMGLYAAVMSKWKPTPIFSFGYGQVEVLSGFLNGLFLVVISFFVFTEALSRLFDPPEIITNRLLVTIHNNDTFKYGLLLSLLAKK